MQAHRFTELIAFWRSVEAFSPQSIPRVAPSHSFEPVRDWERGAPLPWQQPDFTRRQIAPNKAWRHSVYGVIIERAAFIAQLEAKLGKQPNVHEDRVDGQCCVFYLAVDEHGSVLAESFALSMAAWALGIVVARDLAALDDDQACDTAGLHGPAALFGAPPTNSGFPGFDAQSDALRDELAWRVGQLAPGQGIDGAWLADFGDLVVARLGLARLAPATAAHRVKSIQVTRPKPNAAAPAPKSDDDFLNSFFIRDLNRIAQAGAAAAGPGLQRYLEAPAQIERLDVRKERDQALALLHPQLFPAGCWPAAHPLVWSQQLAINALGKALGKNGVFAVNGPPGTGKTTLLRDVVASVVVARARVLLEKGSALFGQRRTIDIGQRTAPYYLLAPELSGFSIVVASSNNGAVENLSLELPSLDAIDPQWAGEADLYGDIAGELLDKPAWALIAGRLGNKANRSAFSGKFWWQSSEGGKVAGLRERLEALRSGKVAPAMTWDEACSAFNTALEHEQGWRDHLAAMAELAIHNTDLEGQQVRVQAAQRTVLEEYDDAVEADSALARSVQDGEAAIAQLASYQAGLREIRPGWFEWLRTFGAAQRAWRERMGEVLDQIRTQESATAALRRQRKEARHALAQCNEQRQRVNDELARLARQLDAARARMQEARQVLGQAWPDLAAQEDVLERSSPWAHPEWHRARIKVFLSALNLHRAFIENNAAPMLSNLGLAMNMLSGALPDPAVRALALESLALACPVISTTFASSASLFAELKPGSIGWLLIDEAGQAPPQAAAGAIWRAARTVVVGDPLQLEPVASLPRSIEASLAAAYGVAGPEWLPSRSSVQALADLATPIGTRIGAADDALWVGAPLRVHRRCDEPMFSISNAIAYDGLMVHGKRPTASPWPPSAWIDVARDTSEGNWVAAEGHALRTLLKQLIHNEEVAPQDVFLISPFRDVVREIVAIGKQFGIKPERIGTVHTTQGKEAQVVILVVGGGSAGARDWVASKPNLLNVAVSRAKTRLYVIGARRDLARRPYFDVLAEHLPVTAGTDYQLNVAQP